MADRPVSRDQNKYIVRFPDGMRDRIAEAARAANRSINAEILARLEASFQSEELRPAFQGTLSDLVEILARLQVTTARLKDEVGLLRSENRRLRAQLPPEDEAEPEEGPAPGP